MNDDAYSKWLFNYNERKKSLKKELMEVGQKALQLESDKTLINHQGLQVAAEWARTKRATMKNKFCFLLWGRHFDDIFFRIFQEMRPF